MNKDIHYMANIIVLDFTLSGFKTKLAFNEYTLVYGVKTFFDKLKFLKYLFQKSVKVNTFFDNIPPIIKGNVVIDIPEGTFKESTRHNAFVSKEVIEDGN